MDGEADVISAHEREREALGGAAEQPMPKRKGEGRKEGRKAVLRWTEGCGEVGGVGMGRLGY